MLRYSPPKAGFPVKLGLLGIDANGADYGDNVTDEFFRLFGDNDGDRDVDGKDHARFIDDYESVDEGFLFDFESRPAKKSPDLIEFTKRYGLKLF